MKKKWLDSLVDPSSKELLIAKIRLFKDGEIIDGDLISSNGHIFPIINGVPRFVSGDLLSAENGNDKDIKKNVQTGKSFSLKWKMGQSLILGRNREERNILEEQFLAMLGIRSKKELKSLFKDGINCLNAGCGVAWSEYLFNVNKRVNRFAIDLSLSTEVAYEKTKKMPNICVVQADLLKLPFKKNYFDIIFSDGVLHHTEDTEKAFNILCEYLKPGGIIGVYLYCKKPFIRELVDREIRKITTEMSFNECLKFSKDITKLGKSLKKIKQNIVIEKDIPLLDIKKGEYDLQKFVYDHFVKCFYNKNANEKFSDLINVDWYHPKYADHHTKEEILFWFKANNLSKIKIMQPKGWEYSGYFVSGKKNKSREND